MNPAAKAWVEKTRAVLGGTPIGDDVSRDMAKEDLEMVAWVVANRGTAAQIARAYNALWCIAREIERSHSKRKRNRNV